MTVKDINDIIKAVCPNDEDFEKPCISPKYLKQELEQLVLEQEPNTWSLDDAREDFMHDVYNTLDFLSTNEEANRIIDSFDRVTSSIEQEPVLDKIRAEIEAIIGERNLDDYDFCSGLICARKIIDKYRIESEDA